RIIGGRGNDRLSGGGGNDRLEGDGGNDRLDGGAGNDRLLGGPGADLLVGGPGEEMIGGGAGRGLLFGGPARGRALVRGGADDRPSLRRRGLRQGADRPPYRPRPPSRVVRALIRRRLTTLAATVAACAVRATQAAAAPGLLVGVSDDAFTWYPQQSAAIARD